MESDVNVEELLVLEIGELEIIGLEMMWMSVMGVRMAVFALSSATTLLLLERMELMKCLEILFPS